MVVHGLCTNMSIRMRETGTAEITLKKRRNDATAATYKERQSPGVKIATVAIVGSPNVGKSVLFNALTKTYVTVSNYPGTTVEVYRGKAVIDGREYRIIDTPGMYSLSPITEDERVSRSLLLEEKPDIVLHVIDAKNIERMLPLTLQLIEAGMRVILVMNMIDEANALGIHIDSLKLEKHLNIPVVPVAAIKQQGISVLKSLLKGHIKKSSHTVNYSEVIEDAVAELSSLLPEKGFIARRLIALLLLLEDQEITELMQKKLGDQIVAVKKIINSAKARLAEPPDYMVTLKRQEETRRLLEEIVTYPTFNRRGFNELLSQITMNPWSGTIILFLVLYYGLYNVVGVFGAGTLVNFIEATVFEQHINPWITSLFATYVPWQMMRDLFVGEYGVFTLGLRYAVAIILPIVGTFFFAFSIIEDSGYFPRMAMLIDRLFKKIGLNGRAVIPMVLGFGCDTMATMVTRVLETKRERIIATLLLALAVPCSAQLGVILGILSARPGALLIWALFITGIFLLIGFLTAKLLPGNGPSFYMEIPPLRLPKLANVLVKTYTRMQWYFAEIVPLFIVASILIWVGNLTGLFQELVNVFKPLVTFMGLPPETAVVFLFGFFRRDYGAAGLYDLSRQLTGTQMVVAAAALTLFLPCIAQFLIMKKERGWKTALAISAFIFPFAFLMGGLLYRLLTIMRVSI